MLGFCGEDQGRTAKQVLIRGISDDHSWLYRL